MAYTHHVLNGRWIPTYNPTIGSHFGMRLGKNGRNGTSVPSFAEKDQEYLVNIFEAKGIKLLDNLDTCPSGLWWHFKEFSYHYPLENNDPTKKQIDTIYFAGYEFKMGKEAHEIMNNK